MDEKYRKKLKVLIKEKGFLTQTALAKASGVSQPQISSLLRGTRKATEKTEDKLFKALETTRSQFYSENQPTCSPETETTHKEMLDDKKKIISMLEKVSILEKENQELKEHINQKALCLEKIKAANLQTRPGDPEGFDPMSERCQAFAIFKEES